MGYRRSVLRAKWVYVHSENWFLLISDLANLAPISLFIGFWSFKFQIVPNLLRVLIDHPIRVFACSICVRQRILRRITEHVIQSVDIFGA